jgi:plasmid stabilization system protein ParE
MPIARVQQSGCSCSPLSKATEWSVHIVFYRAAEPGIIEIVRVLHERMDPWRHFGEQK